MPVVAWCGVRSWSRAEASGVASVETLALVALRPGGADDHAPATVRIRQSRFTLAVPRRIPRSRYLSASLSEQLGLEIRPGRGAALCDPADELPAAVVAALLGISVDTAGRWGALVKRDWTGYIAERDGQPVGPEQT